LKQAEQERLEQQVACTTSIQSVWRCRIAKANFARTVSTTIVLQSFARGLVAKRKRRQQLKEKELIEYECATKIQAAWKGSQEKVNFTRTVSAIVVIQSFVRRMTVHGESNQLKEATILLESAAATKISSSFRGIVCSKKYARTLKGKPGAKLFLHDRMMFSYPLSFA
jgi:myosin heavy subunit